jgi:hypothetical protein
MNKTKNRFEEIANTKLKRLGLYSAVIFIIMFMVEVFSYGLITSYYYFSDRKLDSLNLQFFISRGFVDNPVEKNSPAHFLGHLASPGVMREWWTADPILVWRLGKNVGITHTHGFAEGIEWKVTNSQGFPPTNKLVFNTERKKAAGTFRVIIIGGSTVLGHGSKSPLKTLPSHLASILDQYSKPPSKFTNFELINGGVGGYTSLHEFLFFATELIHYDPDLIILYDGWNDFVFWNKELQTNPDPLSTKRYSLHDNLTNRINASYTFLGAAKQFFINTLLVIPNQSSNFASLFIVKRLFEKLFLEKTLVLSKASDGSGFKVNNLYMNRAHPPFSEKSVEHFKRNILDSIILARGNNIKVALFLQPILGVGGKSPAGPEQDWIRVNADEIKNRNLFYKKARSMLKKVSDSYPAMDEVCVNDLSTSLKNEKNRVFMDSGHLNPQGNSIIAQNILDSLIECGMIIRTDPHIKDADS